jgi:hypothetical protein
VLAWHPQGFRLFSRRRSLRRKVGRPRIPREHIASAQRISSDHPEWGEDRIAEEFDSKLGIHHSTNTIRRYMVARRGSPRGDSSRRTFIRNHDKEIRACDFLTQCTAFFAVVYVFVIREIGSRRIVHVNVTMLCRHRDYAEIAPGHVDFQCYSAGMSVGRQPSWSAK